MKGRSYWAYKDKRTGEILPSTIREREGDCESALRKTFGFVTTHDASLFELVKVTVTEISITG